MKYLILFFLLFVSCKTHECFILNDSKVMEKLDKDTISMLACICSQTGENTQGKNPLICKSLIDESALNIKFGRKEKIMTKCINTDYKTEQNCLNFYNPRE